MIGAVILCVLISGSLLCIGLLLRAVCSADRKVYLDSPIKYVICCISQMDDVTYFIGDIDVIAFHILCNLVEDKATETEIYNILRIIHFDVEGLLSTVVKTYEDKHPEVVRALERCINERANI